MNFQQPALGNQHASFLFVIGCNKASVFKVASKDALTNNVMHKPASPVGIAATMKPGNPEADFSLSRPISGDLMPPCTLTVLDKYIVLDKYTHYLRPVGGEKYCIKGGINLLHVIVLLTNRPGLTYVQKCQNIC